MNPDKALQIIAGLCSKKEYCSRDIREKLKRWELEEKAQQKIMSFLEQHQFVDDHRFARIYAEDKFRFNHWGKQKISMMLHQKGLSTNIITNALKVLDTPDYTESCLEILKQKRMSLPEQPVYQVRAKLTRFALGRGFDFDTINQCLEKLL